MDLEFLSQVDIRYNGKDKVLCEIYNLSLKDCDKCIEIKCGKKDIDGLGGYYVLYSGIQYSLRGGKLYNRHNDCRDFREDSKYIYYFEHHY